jgi:hypothetical protein
MPWTAPRTWTSGEVVTDIILNSHVRDNLVALAGTDGKVLTMSYSMAGSAATTTSTSFVAIPGFTTASMTTLAGSFVVVFAWLSLNGSVAGNSMYLGVQQDALGYVPVGAAHAPVAGYYTDLAGIWLYAPSAGAHTFNLGWFTTGGTATANSQANNGILAIEFRTH